MEVTQSVQRKLVTILALCAFAFVVVSAPVISYFSFTSHTLNANQQQARLVGAVTTSASIAAYVKNEAIAHDVVEGLLLDDEILQARLVGEDGFSVELFNVEPAPAMSSGRPTEYTLRSPVNAEQQVGSLFVWANDGLITERAISSVMNDLLLLVCLSFLFFIASTLAANKLVGSPLRHLAGQLADARPGSDDRIQVDATHLKDEIGLVATSVNSFLDITREALEVERNLRLKLEKLDRHYRNIFASTHVGIVVLDENGFLLHSNPVLLERIIPLDAESQSKLSTHEFFSLVFKRPDEAWKLVAGARKQGDTVSGDLELVSYDDAPVWVHCLISGSRDKDSNEELIEAVVYDITSRIAETSQAQKMAHEDPLTGLQNRRGCQMYFEARAAQAGSSPEMVAMVLDLDGFKAVNDSLGHAAGDQLLQVIAERLRACVRSETDLVGRFGGDEFVVILELQAQNAEAVKRIAQHIIDEISQPIVIDGVDSVAIGVSIGVAYSSLYPDFDQLIEAADAAMYQVKSAGKNSFQFANASGR